jgi:hypothetical protein
MSVKSVYRVSCVCTDGLTSIEHIVLLDDPDTLSTCPNGIVGHTLTSKLILEKISSNTVVIDQSSSVTTGNFFRAEPFNFTAVPGANNFDIVFPYNTSLFNAILRFTTDNIGDTLEVISRPNTPIGLITSPINIGATSLQIPAVLGLNVGFLLVITDGVNTNNLGEITSIDNLTNTLTFSIATTNNFAAGSLASITILLMNTLVINKETDLTLGEGKIKAVGQLANKITRVIYTNNGVANKNVNIIAQLFY